LHTFKKCCNFLHKGTSQSNVFYSSKKLITYWHRWDKIFVYKLDTPKLLEFRSVSWYNFSLSKRALVLHRLLFLLEVACISQIIVHFFTFSKVTFMLLKGDYVVAVILVEKADFVQISIIFWDMSKITQREAPQYVLFADYYVIEGK
jgi:hypothetical protein